MSHYIMTTRIINGHAETQIDPAALPCQRIAAKVPATRPTYISKTAHLGALTDKEFEQLCAQEDENRDQARERFELP